MTTLLRIVHLLALSLWFGSVAFFSFFTALPIIGAMQTHATGGDYWIPLSEKSEGTRLAGDALEPVFRLYFPVQVICGAATLLTLRWWGDTCTGRRRLRLGLLALAFVLVCVNTFYLAREVHKLRTERYVKNEERAAEAKRGFDQWHSFSLWTDMAGLACVTGALALAAASKRDSSV